jgi:hypothetical protein
VVHGWVQKRIFGEKHEARTMPYVQSMQIETKQKAKSKDGNAEKAELATSKGYQRGCF